MRSSPGSGSWKACRLSQPNTATLSSNPPKKARVPRSGLTDQPSFEAVNAERAHLVQPFREARVLEGAGVANAHPKAIERRALEAGECFERVRQARHSR